MEVFITPICKIINNFITLCYKQQNAIQTRKEKQKITNQKYCDVNLQQKLLNKKKLLYNFFFSMCNPNYCKGCPPKCVVTCEKHIDFEKPFIFLYYYIH